MWVQCISGTKKLDVTIFYPFPDGEKVTKIDKIKGYNIVISYEKIEGNTGRLLDQPERAKPHKKF
jgi:hypothetical protein